MFEEIGWWVLKALGGGVVSYLAQRILRNSEDKFQSLQSKRLEDTDQDLEELLSHLIEELSGLDPANSKDAERIIKMRLAVSKAYLRIQFDRLMTGQDESDVA